MGGVDYSGDSKVDLSDLAILCNNWLAADYGNVEGADLTGDEWVDWDDLDTFVENWLQGP